MSCRAASDSSAQVQSNWLFEKDVLHAAGILVLPIAIIALVLLYCASGRDRWKKSQSDETRPLVRPTLAAPARSAGLTRRAPQKLAPHSKSAVAFVAVPIVEERHREAPQRDGPLVRERAEPTGVFLGVRPNSNAMRSTGF